MSKNDGSGAEELSRGKLGLWSLAFTTVAAIYPMAMAVSNASAAVAYAGFAAPLVPLMGALLMLFASIPVLEYARLTAFAGGIYGLAELGFGIVVGKFVGMVRLLFFLLFDSLTATAFAYIIYTSLIVLFNYKMPGLILVILTIMFLILMYIFGVIRVTIAAWINNLIQILQIIILIIFSIYVIILTPYNSPQAFNPYMAPGGLNGFFLAVILAGFLFYTGYDAPLYFSEEGKAPFKDVWRAIAYGTILSALVGTLTMYAEVVAVGPEKLNDLTVVLNPGLSAYMPYLGFMAGIIFTIVAWLGQLMGGVVPGLSAMRELYSLARDRFFGKVGYIWLTKLNKYEVPSNAALVNLLLGIVTTVTIESLMIYYYGLPEGAFYALFLSGSMVVAYWFILYMIIDLALAAFFKKRGIKILTPRNFITSIVAPAGGVTVFGTALYMGYSSLPEPYFSGFLFVIFSTIASLIYVLIMKRYRGSYWESYVSKRVRL